MNVAVRQRWKRVVSKGAALFSILGGGEAGQQKG